MNKSVSESWLLEARSYLRRTVDLPMTLPTDPVFLGQARDLLEQAAG